MVEQYLEVCRRASLQRRVESGADFGSPGGTLPAYQGQSAVFPFNVNPFVFKQFPSHLSDYPPDSSLVLLFLLPGREGIGAVIVIAHHRINPVPCPEVGKYIHERVCLFAAERHQIPGEHYHIGVLAENFPYGVPQRGLSSFI